MTQSRRMSLVEAATNVIVGYALAVGMQIAVFPVFGIHIALGDQLAIGLAFTGVSLAAANAWRALAAAHGLWPVDLEAAAGGSGRAADGHGVVT